LEGVYESITLTPPGKLNKPSGVEYVAKKVVVLAAVTDLNTQPVVLFKKNLYANPGVYFVMMTTPEFMNTEKTTVFIK
jgi:hypothetical protein